MSKAWCNKRYLAQENVDISQKSKQLAKKAYLYSLCATLVLQNDKLKDSKYHSFKKPKYLKILKSCLDEKTDMEATLFYDELKDEYILAYAGTNSIKDWMANFIGYFRIKHYEKSLEFFLDCYKEYGEKMVVCGFSLGGALSIYCSKRYGKYVKEVYAFNSSPLTLSDISKNTNIYLLSTYNDALKPFRAVKRLIVGDTFIKDNIDESFHLIKQNPFANHQPWVLTRNLLHIADLSDQNCSAYSILQDSKSIFC